MSSSHRHRSSNHKSNSSRGDNDRERVRDNDRSHNSHRYTSRSRSRSREADSSRDTTASTRDKPISNAKPIFRRPTGAGRLARRGIDISTSQTTFNAPSTPQRQTSGPGGAMSSAVKNSGGTISGDTKKPKFLNRDDREALAMQRLRDKRSAQQQQQRQSHHERSRFFQQVREMDNKGRSRHQHNDGGGGNDRDRNNRGGGGSNIIEYKSREERAKERASKKKEDLKLKELQLIKDQKLGKKEPKKQVVPPSQKFKFNFDWEPNEDTSEDLNELYVRPAKIALRFGRGYMAGIDREEQDKKNKSIYKELVKNRTVKIHKQDDDLAGMLEEKRRKRMDKAQKEKEREQMEARNWRDKTLDEMTDRDWRILKEEFRIATKFGGRLPFPIRLWDESGLPLSILRAIKDVAKYDQPSPIQRMAIPVGLQNRDCVGIAETGSGKTAAFVLPMLVYLLTLPPMDETNAEDGPYSLVLAPTRELARQIEEETNKFATFIKIRCVTMIGGVDIEAQSMTLREGIECIIATPGRLNDCIDRRYLVLNQCNYVVLDEADRMIDMGFEPQVLAIFEAMPASNMRPLEEEEVEESRVYRQTFMFSATMPPAVERITRQYLRNPVYVTIGDPNATAAERVQQHVMWIDSEAQKRKKLQELLPSMDPLIMIFVNNRKVAEDVSKFLRSQHYRAIALHGGKSQDNRERALATFRSKKEDILVCTNVAGRGIDVEGVQHVVNYDMPLTIQDYCHRIGRTGRAGQEGTATSFIVKTDTDIMYDLKKMLLKTNNSCPNELLTHEAAMRNPKDPFSLDGKKRAIKQFAA